MNPTRFSTAFISGLHLQCLPWQLLGGLGGGVPGAGELTVTVAMAVAEPPLPVQVTE